MWRVKRFLTLGITVSEWEGALRNKVLYASLSVCKQRFVHGFLVRANRIEYTCNCWRDDFCLFTNVYVNGDQRSMIINIFSCIWQFERNIIMGNDDSLSLVSNEPMFCIQCFTRISQNDAGHQGPGEIDKLWIVQTPKVGKVTGKAIQVCHDINVKLSYVHILLKLFLLSILSTNSHCFSLQLRVLFIIVYALVKSRKFPSACLWRHSKATNALFVEFLFQPFAILNRYFSRCFHVSSNASLRLKIFFKIIEIFKHWCLNKNFLGEIGTVCSFIWKMWRQLEFLDFATWCWRNICFSYMQTRNNVI